MNKLSQAFLADIIANPQDNSVRLIYSDWLEESGEKDLAEFIRVQIELEKLPCATFIREDRYDQCILTQKSLPALQLHQRELQLLWQSPEEFPVRYNWERWCWAEARNEEGEPTRKDPRRGAFTATPNLGIGLGNPYSVGCTVDSEKGTVSQKFRRGFVSCIGCKLETWLDVGPDIVKKHPVEFVLIKNKYPKDHHDNVHYWTNGTRYGPDWRDRDTDDVTYHLPLIIAKHMHNPTVPPHLWASVPAISFSYPNRLIANQDLSDACLRYANDH
jgi:uncharacterized protein (TIGR02996 family)